MTKPLLTVLALLLTVLSNVALAQPSPPPPPTIEYYHLDAVGSVRAVSNENGQVVRRHDYFAFGEEYLAQGGNDPRRFTGKERDSETGLDYFGARYYGQRTGRFTTVDPLAASSRLTDPQTFNRYAYALNNPLRFIDPDGLEVPASCARDPKCTILVRINVIFDSGSTGMTSDERAAFEREQIETAQKAYGVSNIKLDVTYSSGTVTIRDTKVDFTGTRNDALNLVVTLKYYGAKSLIYHGAAVSMVNPRVAYEWGVYPMVSHTTSHEFGHQFLGHTDSRRSGRLANAGNDLIVDTHLLLQGRGFSQSAFRMGLQPRGYAVPLSAAITTPKR